MSKKKLIELGVRIEEARINLQDVCVYLGRFEKVDDLAVAELVLENVKALRSRFEGWASLEFGFGLSDAVLGAVREKAET